ncbi:SRPBCC family protein [Modestobacter sp. VKM Ac-2979]|uniref:SRPBCC family protein n=1 Tax=unclassified Modestobacter TaxID=2643866 RepID=UPI0022AB6CB6|nr:MULTISPECIES: SRPBCC family protein [unclassified Modestobacter]MCZ2809940.1 SRPBCC family protein [Modestobacter sp. VKM Ac-2979]MCZ2842645.1 SRPBCC family protein [Modestobacter sp. VKM Ac-2980]
MTTKVEESIQVDVPVRTAYDQWTQFEDFPHFMGGVKEVQQRGDQRLHWVAEIAGVKREWDAAILEQVPDQKIAWAATGGATNAGAVRFEPAGPASTIVHLTLEYEPEGVVEQAGDKLGIVGRQVKSDLAKFKDLIEDEGYASGAWRGSVRPGMGAGTPGVEDAASSRGDSGKAGISAKSVVAGVAAVAAAGAAVAASKSGSDDESQPESQPQSQPREVPAAPPVVPAQPVTGVEQPPAADVRDEVLVEQPDAGARVTPAAEANTPTGRDDGEEPMIRGGSPR